MLYISVHTLAAGDRCTPTRDWHNFPVREFHDFSREKIDILLALKGRGFPTAVGRLRFAGHHRIPRLESSGAVMKGDCWLCQPAGTPNEVDLEISTPHPADGAVYA